MAKRNSGYIWQFTIGLGFLSGIWSAVGIDPQEVLLGLLGAITRGITADPAVLRIFVILPLLLLAVSVWGAYRKGGVVGLISVLIAYLAGLSILLAVWTSLLLLVVAIAAGYLATARRIRT